MFDVLSAFSFSPPRVYAILFNGLVINYLNKRAFALGIPRVGAKSEQAAEMIRKPLCLPDYRLRNQRKLNSFLSTDCAMLASGMRYRFRLEHSLVTFLATPKAKQSNSNLRILRLCEM